MKAERERETGAWHVSGGPLWASSACPPRRGRGAVVVGRTMFETDRAPDGWARRLNAVLLFFQKTHTHSLAAAVHMLFERLGLRIALALKAWR